MTAFNDLMKKWAACAPYKKHFAVANEVAKLQRYNEQVIAENGRVDTENQKLRARIELLERTVQARDTDIAQEKRLHHETKLDLGVANGERAGVYNAGAASVIELIEPILGGKWLRGKEGAQDYVERQVAEIRYQSKQPEPGGIYVTWAALHKVVERTVCGQANIALHAAIKEEMESR